MDEDDGNEKDRIMKEGKIYKSDYECNRYKRKEWKQSAEFKL